MKVFLLLLLLGMNCIAIAGYTTEADVASQRELDANKKEQVWNELVKSPIGKTYWLDTPNSKHRINFYESFSPQSIRAEVLKDMFYPNKKTSFKVLELIENKKYFLKNDMDLRDGKDSIYRIVFEDGKEGFIWFNALLPNKPPSNYQGKYISLLDIYTLSESDDDYIKNLTSFVEHIYTEDPDKIKERLASKDATLAEEAAKDAAISKEANLKVKAKKIAAKNSSKKPKKSGVIIGMTAAEVKASSWGRPHSVNRTTTPYGTSEQWVYGAGNYLYFDDGVLTTVQN